MKLIVGLGNPGKEYEQTYHNLGFMAIDKVAKHFKTTFDKLKGKSMLAKIKTEGQIVLLIKPLTYMNLSGQAVAYFAKYYKLEPQDIVVLCDDIDLPKGEVKFRQHGSGGTHNGLKSIVSALSSEDFARIKIGAGDNNISDLKDYVLSKIDGKSFETIQPCLDGAVQKVLTWLAQ